MDFDDLLMQTVILFQRYPEVAEKYQTRLEHVLSTSSRTPTSPVQAGPGPGRAAEQPLRGGRPDQSIYAFRGADYRNVLRFERDYPDHTKVLLSRITAPPAHPGRGDAIIDRNPNRTPQRLFTDRGRARRSRSTRPTTRTTRPCTSWRRSSPSTSAPSSTLAVAR
jgi:DNA helicase-2/ATP-dependent DNA helicase PcrA